MSESFRKESSMFPTYKEIKKALERDIADLENRLVAAKIELRNLEKDYKKARKKYS
jgi:hypothetical protein